MYGCRTFFVSLRSDRCFTSSKGTRGCRIATGALNVDESDAKDDAEDRQVVDRRQDGDQHAIKEDHTNHDLARYMKRL